MLIKIDNDKPSGMPLVNEQFFALFPNTSFSTPLTPDQTEPLGFGVYDYTSQPEPSKYQKVVEVEPVKDAQGIYRQTWAVVEMNTEEQFAEDTRKASEVRSERNWKLTRSDWTQIADAQVNKAAWATYRQALRDITSQAGFPWTINWPEQPI